VHIDEIQALFIYERRDALRFPALQVGHRRKIFLYGILNIFHGLFFRLPLRPTTEQAWAKDAKALIGTS
jgi:hypothetical protein